MAKVNKNGRVAFRLASSNTAFKMRYDSIQGTVFSMEYNSSFKQFESRVEMIHKYYHSAPVTEALREDVRFDACRSNQFPDNVVVIFLKEGANPEEIWCRLMDVKDEKIYGRMMNEPYADFGPHSGDLIEISLVNIDGQLKAVAMF